MEKLQKKNYKISKIIWKIRTIILSRFKKPQNQEWVELKRSICKNCPHNTNKTTKLSLKVRLLQYLSDFLTWITLNKKTNLGFCGHKSCGCDIFYKTEMEDESCPEGWWSIHKPNSSNTKRGKKIKNGNS